MINSFRTLKRLTATIWRNAASLIPWAKSLQQSTTTPARLPPSKKHRPDFLAVQVRSRSQQMTKNDRSLSSQDDPPPSAARSALMARVHSRDTRPEKIVRKAVHGLGFRYRLHRKDLPGTPDLTFPRLRRVIFVHGCFWHRHQNCPKATTPRTRYDFWQGKFDANTKRDRRAIRALKAHGWKPLVVWECETSASKTTKLRLKLQRFLAEG